MADIELVTKIPEEMVQELKDGCFGLKHTLYDLARVICDGVVLPKGQFIAICESDYPITEKVENTLKETVFIGGDEEHEDMYCFDIKEIIEADKN